MRGLHNGYKRGFALPTVLIASVILLSVLAVAVSATAAVRTSLKNQYYEQLAQTAGEAGVAYAKACLAANGNVPQWTDAKPLTPATDCAGNNILSPVVQTLIVGGGGGGASRHGGGGGAGGVIYNSELSITTGNYSVVVGNGGSGTANGNGAQDTATNGGNSSVFGLTAIGGGAGRGSSGNGLSGGSGGGGAIGAAGGSGTAGQGYAGAGGVYSTYYMGGGGGGAGGVGTVPVYPSSIEAPGGPGVSNSITGAAITYATGGKGGVYNTNTVGIAGAGNTGNGGGGAGGETNGGGAGGSGIVIISYLTNGGVTANATGAVTTTSNGLYTVRKFTGNGNFDVTSAGASTCPSDPRCSVTINDNVRSSFSIARPTLDADGKAVKIPAGGYTEITRTSTGAVWRTYKQPSVQAAVVPDLCSGATSSTLGWQAVALTSTQISFSPSATAQTISIADTALPFGPTFYRKDFSVTSAGTYDVGVQVSGTNDDADMYIDGKHVAKSDNGSLGTASTALSAGCHHIFVRLTNSSPNLSNNAALFAASVVQQGASVPVAVSDGSWRATAGGTVNFAHKDFYVDSGTWGLVRDIQSAVSINSGWTGVSGESGARWISTTHSLSGGVNYPGSSYAYFRDSRTITVTSPTDVRITYDCDDNCEIYLDGSKIANGLWNNVYSTTVTLSEGTHQLGGILYNYALGGAGLAISATRISDGAVLSWTDASWLSGIAWTATNSLIYSYDASFIPVPNTEPQAIARILVVGGGGGGGGTIAGGGGGGAVVYKDSQTLNVRPYSIIVGTGGIGGVGWDYQPSYGTAGGVSSFSSIYAVGGGGGAGHTTAPIGGASGGGGANTYTVGEKGILGLGNQGGMGNTNDGGGGGGASAAGVNYGAGGAGVANSITGSSVTYGGGGGGGGRAGSGTADAGGIGGGGAGSINSTLATAGTANTGGGGGGSGYNGGSSAVLGGAGGSGVVVISYITGSMTATGGTITTSGGYTIHRFTSSGTFTVTSIP